MARIRTIKPEFPQSETIGKLSREARLLFILLWTICDDSGRTRAASRMLASLLYPYDDDARALIPEWLIELDKAGCIRLYEVEGNTYLEIPKWLTHQKIDRPSLSKFPAFDEGSRVCAEPSRKIAQDQGPRTGTKDQGAEERPPQLQIVKADADQAFAAYQGHAELHGWPNPQFLNSTRRWAIQARLAECGGMAGWIAALDAAVKAEFLKGQQWFDLDWMLKPENFTRLMEGRYAERHRSEPKSGLTAALAGLVD